MPSGALRISSKSFWLVGENPSSSLLRRVAFRLKIRITIFSPNTVGKTETRMSTSLPSMVVSIRPSWGIRRSAMSRPLMILIRVAMAEWALAFNCMFSTKVPSTRKRTRTTFSKGSIWISLVRVLIAWLIIESIKRTTGAFLISRSSSTISSSTLKPSISVAACWASSPLE